jgi:septal ring factor EnvC (AmiA/AmiB activator)
MASKRRSDLVVRDKQGEIYSVRYEAVNAMLVNEFLKEHKKVDEQEASIAQLKSTVAKQQKDFETTAAKQQREIQVLTAQLKEQAAQIQKVSAQLEMSKPAPQIVRNNPYICRQYCPRITQIDANKKQGTSIHSREFA